MTHGPGFAHTQNIRDSSIEVVKSNKFNELGEEGDNKDCILSRYCDLTINKVKRKIRNTEAAPDNWFKALKIMTIMISY